MATPSRNPEPVTLRPQPGPQETFLSTSADIAFYGGAAGGGKTWAQLFEPLRHVRNRDFGAVIFRRTCPEITNQGGLWDESVKLYPLAGGLPKVGDLQWDFPSGARVRFAHLQHEADVLKWHSSQVPLIEFDELTTFTEYQVTYMFSRNRSTCGVRPYIRGGCNPDAASWVARWVDWYVDPATGYPIPERAGRLRWFVRDGETLRWADTRQDLERQYPAKTPKSFTFIPAKLEDNRVLEEADPGYRAWLEALPRVEHERLLKGNWLISNAEGEWPPDYFGRHLYFPAWPAQRDCCVLAWDPSRGADARFGDYSAFTVLLRGHDGLLYADAALGRWPVEEAIDVGLDLCRLWKPDGFAIEINQFQQLVKSNLERRARELKILAPTYAIDNRVKKEVRIRRLGPLLAQRLLRLKGESPGARLLAEQLMVFPNGEHDDGPDSLEMAVRLMNQLLGERGSQQQTKRMRA